MPGHYDLLATDTTLTVYENPFALPLAYVGASAALEIEIDSTDNTFALQNEMLRALVPGTADALVPAAIEFSQSAQGIFLTFTPACDGPVYLAIPGLDEATPADVRVDGELIGEYFTMDSLGGVMPLGSFAAGQQVEVYLGFADSAKARAAIEIYSLDETGARFCRRDAARRRAAGPVRAGRRPHRLHRDRLCRSRPACAAFCLGGRRPLAADRQRRRG